MAKQSSYIHFGVKQLSVKLHIYIGSLHPYMCMKSCRISGLHIANLAYCYNSYIRMYCTLLTFSTTCVLSCECT